MLRVKGYGTFAFSGRPYDPLIIHTRKESRNRSTAPKRCLGGEPLHPMNEKPRTRPVATRASGPREGSNIHLPIWQEYRKSSKYDPKPKRSRRANRKGSTKNPFRHPFPRMTDSPPLKGLTYPLRPSKKTIDPCKALSSMISLGSLTRFIRNDRPDSIPQKESNERKERRKAPHPLSSPARKTKMVFLADGLRTRSSNHRRRDETPSQTRRRKTLRRSSCRFESSSRIIVGSSLAPRHSRSLRLPRSLSKHRTRITMIQRILGISFSSWLCFQAPPASVA